MLGARTGAQASRYRTLVRAGSPFDHPYGSSHVILLYENEYRTTFSRRLTLREQIRGDYGSSFKTSATIVITLDTDAGTLRFSSWKDSNTSGSFSLDPVSQSLFSPKKSGHIAGVVEDWGVAFEGLPLDAKLFPAVGLYQRDDRLTILQVENPSQNSGWGVHGGSRCYPFRLSFPHRKHNRCFIASSPHSTCTTGQDTNFYLVSCTTASIFTT